jgi:cysteine sulfinate desulfinase/cysteine desulfurase-like protein
MDPDIVLKAMSFSAEIQTSAIRVSFSDRTSLEDVKTLAAALNDSILHMQKLLGGM